MCTTRGHCVCVGGCPWMTGSLEGSRGHLGEIEDHRANGQEGQPGASRGIC